MAFYLCSGRQLIEYINLQIKVITTKLLFSELIDITFVIMIYLS